MHLRRLTGILAIILGAGLAGGHVPFAIASTASDPSASGPLGSGPFGSGASSSGQSGSSGTTASGPTASGATGSGPSGQRSDQASERPILHWEAPVAREDRSRLYPHEIHGYRVYYRLRHQEEFRSKVVKVNKLPLKPFDMGAYEFAVSTIDQKGRESRRSEPVSVNLL